MERRVESYLCTANNNLLTWRNTKLLVTGIYSRVQTVFSLRFGLFMYYSLQLYSIGNQLFFHS